MYLRKLVLCLLLAIAFTQPVSAQLYNGLSTSSWGGVSNVSFNPAIADSKYKLDISLGAFAFNYSNTYAGISSSSYFGSNFLSNYVGGDIFHDALFRTGVTGHNTNAGTQNFYTGSQVQGPLSFMVSFGKKNKTQNAIAITYHLNVVKNIDGLDAGFANSLFDPSQAPASFTNPALNIKSMSWADYGFTYSRVLVDKEKHFFKAGVTAKLLQGVGATYLHADNISGSGSSVTATNVTYQHTADYFDYNTPSSFTFSRAAPSVGFDLGAVYEWRPKKSRYYYEMDGDTGLLMHEKNLYTIAVGFSIVDMGVINFTADPATAGTYGSINASTSGAASVTGTSDVDHAFSGSAASASSFKMLLPTRFNIYADFNAVVGAGASISANISPVFRDNQVHHVTTIMLVPHFERAYVGVYLPMSVDLNSKLALGMALRLGPVTFGIQNLVGLAMNSNYNNSIYASVKIPLAYVRKKDSDHDKVSDKKDNCPNQPGTWATMGCPDLDGDGVPDREDSCKNEPGELDNHGCPWPDYDKDGIPDKDDSCKYYKGPIERHGCPWGDTDGDGLTDEIDGCPNEKGPKENHGCPWPDKDNDGVPDKDDDCKDDAGPKANHGCPWPDHDGDGIPDKDDKCPNDYGPLENKGCPLNERTVPDYQEMLNIRPDTAHFAKKSAVLYKTSIDKIKYGLLTSLKNQPTIDVLLIGYADSSEGDSVENLELSEERANAVKDYLVENGIDEDRIEVRGYGTREGVANVKMPIQNQIVLFIEHRISKIR